MIVKFGNLKQPRHSESKPEAEDKLTEMMQKLHEAGYERQENIRDGVNDGKFYHVFDLPHQIEFGDDAEEAIDIMTPYADYMKPLMVVAPKTKGGKKDKTKQKALQNLQAKLPELLNPEEN